ncbi:hypothetical protein LZ554_004275 [Drepanopeziza brunnea f. sp. 'monogermtubi']|nr:hypothetical protein LZ554_004275 [Drepanopeziza brunnea f. sp. 'monogermtubi']
MLASSFDAATLLSALASSALIYMISLVIYRLTLHPLAKYPGPFLAKICDVDNFYHAWRGDRHTNFFYCHEKYGPVYRYGPNRLSFNTANALHDIHGHKTNVQKAGLYSAFVRGTAVSTLTCVDKVRHAQKRRVISHAFSDRALKSMEQYILEPIREFCTVLQQSGGKEALNMNDWDTYLLFDIMGALAFGRSFKLLTSSENRYVPEIMHIGSVFGNINGNALWAHSTGLSNLLMPQGSAGRRAFRAYAQKEARDRMALGAGGTDRKDFFHYLIEAKDPQTGEGFTLSDLWSEANLILIAGSDTSSAVMSGTFFYLTHNPTILATVTREVRDAFAGGQVEDIVSGSKLNSCIYLRACLDESMRISPPVPGPLPREVCAGGAMIDGTMVPAGIDVSVGTWAIHHNKDYYPSPHTYNPSRWIAADSIPASAGYAGVARADVEKAQRAFAAFSLGPRGCIGRNMAYIELTLAMARVLFLFDLELASTLGEGGPGGEWMTWDNFNAHKEGPVLRFVPRKV